MGRGRNFEVSLPPSQLRVGGILGWHWHVWQSFGADEWTVVVLQDVYKVPFHHLPPVSLEPRGLSSFSLGLVRALTLKEDVSKLIQKGPLELMDQPNSGFYSWLFLVEEVTGLAARHRSVISQWLRHADEVQDGDHSVCVWVCQEGDWMFSIDLKGVYFQISVHWESRPYLQLCIEECVYQFHALCVHDPAVVHQSLRSGFGIGSPEGCAPSLLPGRLASHCGVGDTSAAVSGSRSPNVQGSGGLCQLIEV